MSMHPSFYRKTAPQLKMQILNRNRVALGQILFLIGVVTLTKEQA